MAKNKAISLKLSVEETEALVGFVAREINKKIDTEAKVNNKPIVVDPVAREQWTARILDYNRDWLFKTTQFFIQEKLFADKSLKDLEAILAHNDNFTIEDLDTLVFDGLTRLDIADAFYPGGSSAYNYDLIAKRDQVLEAFTAWLKESFRSYYHHPKRSRAQKRYEEKEAMAINHVIGENWSAISHPRSGMPLRSNVPWAEEKFNAPEVKSDEEILYDGIITPERFKPTWTDLLASPVCRDGLVRTICWRAAAGAERENFSSTISPTKAIQTLLARLFVRSVNLEELNKALKEKLQIGTKERVVIKEWEDFTARHKPHLQPLDQTQPETVSKDDPDSPAIG